MRPRLVVREMPDARFVILGEGELRPALEHQIQRPPSVAARACSPASAPTCSAVLKGLDLFVMSSVTEGLGTSLLDAMAAARPDRRHADRAASPKSWSTAKPACWRLRATPRRLADAILQLLRDGPGRERLAQAGFARVERALQRGPDGRADARGLRGRGRHQPRSGHRESANGRLKPHRSCMPTWHSAKSYLTGSAGSNLPERRA